MDRSKWEYKKLGDLCSKLTDGSHNPPKGIENSDYRMISSQNIFNDKIVLNDYRYLSKEDFETEDKRTALKKGDLLLTIVGAIGRCYVLNGTEGNLTLQRSVAALTPKDTISSRFLMYYFIGNNANLLEEAHGAAQKGIYLRQLSNLIVPVPTLDDQQRIVAELDCLNEMIALKQEQLKEFDKLAQSIFYDMFGDPMDNVHEWGISILEDVVSDSCSISYGIVQPGEDVENGVPVVRPVDLVNQVVYKDGLKIVDKAISDSYKRTILKGDELLFCVRGTTGIISFASEELKGCNVTRGITPLEFGERINKYYAYYLLKTPYLQSLIAEKTNGIALKQINMRDVRLLPIMCPPLALQQQFAEKIQAIESQKELVKQSIAETQQLLKSRMDYYFD